MKTCDESSKFAISCYITIYEPSIYINQSVLGELFQQWHQSMYLFSKLWYQGCLKIRSDYNWIEFCKFMKHKRLKMWQILDYIFPNIASATKFMRTLEKLLICWSFFLAFSKVWSQPIFHDVAKTVQIGTCQPRMIFMSSQKEYKRDKRESWKYTAVYRRRKPRVGDL